MNRKLTPFDPAEHLMGDQAVADFIAAAVETDDPAYVAHTIGVVARTRGLTMTKEIRVSELTDFDAAEYLISEEEITAYLKSVIEENDPALLAAALGDIARARAEVLLQAT